MTTEIAKTKIVDIMYRYSNIIAFENNFNELVKVMSNMGQELANADRCTIWLVDKHTNELWTKVGQGLDKEIRIPKTGGIVGAAIASREALIINDPYNDKRFNKEIDKKNNYKTDSILVIPIIDMHDEVMGAFQVINKKADGGFRESDIDNLMLATSMGGKILIAENYEEINKYNEQEQKSAYQKQKSIIVNDLEDDKQFNVKTFYRSADTLCGDTYSIFKTKNGDTLFMLLDAMGHGILPSLTAFAANSTVREHIKKVNNLQELSVELLKSLAEILDDYEQLSYSFFWLKNDFSKIEYISGGTYPVCIKMNNDFKLVKPNNLPIMSFTPSVAIGTIELTDFEGILLYSDGLVEDTGIEMDTNSVHKMYQDDIYDKMTKFLSTTILEDDTTIILATVNKNDKDN